MHGACSPPRRKLNTHAHTHGMSTVVLFDGQGAQRRQQQQLQRRRVLFNLVVVFTKGRKDQGATEVTLASCPCALCRISDELSSREPPRDRLWRDRCEHRQRQHTRAHRDERQQIYSFVALLLECVPLLRLAHMCDLQGPALPRARLANWLAFHEAARAQGLHAQQSRATSPHASRTRGRDSAPRAFVMSRASSECACERVLMKHVDVNDHLPAQQQLVARECHILCACAHAGFCAGRRTVSLSCAKY